MNLYQVPCFMKCPAQAGEGMHGAGALALVVAWPKHSNVEVANYE